jgi:hypothetical protein
MTFFQISDLDFHGTLSSHNSLMKDFNNILHEIQRILFEPSKTRLKYSRGHPPTPNKHLYKELKRRCRVRLTPEFRTSVTCSKCYERLQDTRYWAIKKCNTTNCLMLWDRDVNAARNIRHVFLYRNSTMEKGLFHLCMCSVSHSKPGIVVMVESLGLLGGR